MGSIKIIKPLLSTALSSSAVDKPRQHQQFSLKKVANAGIRTQGSRVRKRERYHCAVPDPPPTQHFLSMDGLFRRFKNIDIENMSGRGNYQQLSSQSNVTNWILSSVRFRASPRREETSFRLLNRIPECPSELMSVSEQVLTRFQSDPPTKTIFLLEKKFALNINYLGGWDWQFQFKS